VVLSLPRQSPHESRLALTLQFYLNIYESESAPVAWVALPRGRSNAVPPYLSSHRAGEETLSSSEKSSTGCVDLNRALG